MTCCSPTLNRGILMFNCLATKSAPIVITLLCAHMLSGCVTKTVPVVASASSYECRPMPVDGLPMAGEGAYGCHFQLLDTETKEILVNTPYSLDVYAPSKSAASETPFLTTLKGVTDAHGRSGFIRAPFPITPERIRFVRVVGSGPYGLSPQLLRPTDGAGVAGMHYHVTGCGYDQTGITDEQGLAPLFLSVSECKLKAAFYMCRNGKCPTK